MKKLILQYHFWITGLLGFVLTSCHTKYRVWVGKGNEQKIFNYAYGEHKKQKMDIFLPNLYTYNTPIIVLIHGGAWKFGRKEHFIKVQKFLHKNGFPTVNLNYQLVKKGITYKNQLKDIALALEKMNTFTSKAHLLKNNYILLGESAGGHLALLYAYQNPQQIKKIIALSPPTDFYSETYLKSKYSYYSSPIFEDVVGVKFDRKNLSNAFVEASPISQVTDVPTLHFQGNKDILVNYQQGLKLDFVLTKNNIPHRFILMKNTGHTPRFSNKKKRDSIIYPAILEWIKRRF